MATHSLPAGQHERHGLSTVPVALRHFLLWLLPAEPGSPDSWRSVACAFGDLAEDFFAALAITASVGMVAITLLILWWLHPLLVIAALDVALIVLAAWRMRVRVRRLEQAEEASGDR